MYASLAAVMGVQVEQVPDSDTSVLVLWIKMNITEVTNYTLFYSPVAGQQRQDEMSMTVPSNENFVTITNLASDVEYQFQVSAIAEFRGQQFMGQRSQIIEDPRVFPEELSTTLEATSTSVTLLPVTSDTLGDSQETVSNGQWTNNIQHEATSIL